MAKDKCDSPAEMKAEHAFMKRAAKRGMKAPKSLKSHASLKKGK